MTKKQAGVDIRLSGLVERDVFENTVRPALEILSALLEREAGIKLMLKEKYQKPSDPIFYSLDVMWDDVRTKS